MHGAELVSEVANGIWAWLPLGLRMHRKVEAIIRAEHEAVGAAELLLPLLSDAGLFERWGAKRETLVDRLALDVVGPGVLGEFAPHVAEHLEFAQLMQLKDRHGQRLTLPIDHVLVAADQLGGAVRTAADLPLRVFQIQLKHRDERHPRAGVIRSREFVMGDAYSFDRDRASMEEAYWAFGSCYERILDRCELEWLCVEADAKSHGNLLKHEYATPCQSGTDFVTRINGTWVNAEVASAVPDEPPALSAVTEVPAGAPEPEAVAARAGTSVARVVRSTTVLTESGRRISLQWRGDDELNDGKTLATIGEAFRFAEDDAGETEVIADKALLNGQWLLPRSDGSATVVQYDEANTSDLRCVKEGDRVESGRLRLVRVMEVGNIVQVGTGYTAPFDVRNELGEPTWMGAYGLGIGRLIAASAEQHWSEGEVTWPHSLAPFLVHLQGAPALCRKIGEALGSAAEEILIEDRSDQSLTQQAMRAARIGCPIKAQVRPAEDEGVTLTFRIGRDAQSEILHCSDYEDAAAKLADLPASH